MSRLIIISNRVSQPREGAARAGGLAVALRDLLYDEGGVWIGWSGETKDGTARTPHVVEDGPVTFATLDLGREDHRRFYIGYANGTIWPLCHFRPGLMTFDPEDFAGYMRVNEAFADVVAEFAKPEDRIWVHDYHLFPLASALRERGLTNTIGFFLHIPVPPPELFAALPRHEALLDAMADYNLIGLQTVADRDALARMLAQVTGARITAHPDFEASRLEGGRRPTTLAHFPIGIDTAQFEDMARKAASSRDNTRLALSLRGRSSIIGVDRLDISKGIPLRFEAFRDLLRRYPEVHHDLHFLQIAPPSRMDVAQYRRLRAQLESLAGQINAEFSEFDWMPLRYLNKGFARPTLAGFYRLAKVGLVTPLRDGMNLVAKEYVAAQDPEDPGLPVLSRFCGAAHELTEALIVNPFDPSAVADAIHKALNMDVEERRQRHAKMLGRLRDHDIRWWRDAYLAALNRVAGS